MANKKLSDGVGKKIVEALKQQSEIEVTPISENQIGNEDILTQAFGEENTASQNIFENESFTDTEDYLDSLSSDENESFIQEEPALNFAETPIKQNEQPFIQYQQPSHVADSFIKELDTFEIPGNIAVLKKLISQLPSGVTKHTGAQIIKQTMEALGISMKSVLQEAQQVQDGLSNSAKECHATIQEYKKQITLLEKQSQNYQRQYAALNDLISLFIQTGV